MSAWNTWWEGVYFEDIFCCGLSVHPKTYKNIRLFSQKITRPSVQSTLGSKGTSLSNRGSTLYPWQTDYIRDDFEQNKVEMLTPGEVRIGRIQGHLGIIQYKMSELGQGSHQGHKYAQIQTKFKIEQMYGGGRTCCCKNIFFKNVMFRKDCLYNIFKILCQSLTFQTLSDLKKIFIWKFSFKVPNPLFQYFPWL